jgi:hypothetical protein
MFGYTMKTTYMNLTNFHPLFFSLTSNNWKSPKSLFSDFHFLFLILTIYCHFKKRLIPPYLWSPINTISCHFPLCKKLMLFPIHWTCSQYPLPIYFFKNVNYKYKTLVSSMLPKSGWKWKLIIYYFIQKLLFIILIIHCEQLRQ